MFHCPSSSSYPYCTLGSLLLISSFISWCSLRFRFSFFYWVLWWHESSICWWSVLSRSVVHTCESVELNLYLTWYFTPVREFFERKSVPGFSRSQKRSPTFVSLYPKTNKQTKKFYVEISDLGRSLSVVGFVEWKASHSPSYLLLIRPYPGD